MNPGALHALWTLEGLGAISKNPAALAAVRKAIYHPAASVRRAALQVLPRDAQLIDDILKAGILPDRTSAHNVEYTVPSNLLQDANGQVRLNALLAISEAPPSAKAQQAIKDALAVPANLRDQWIPHAIAIAAVKQGADFPIQLLQPRGGPGASAPDAAQQGRGGGRGGAPDPAEVGMREITNIFARHYLAAGDGSHFADLIIATAKTNQGLAATLATMAAPPAPPPDGRGGGGAGGGGGRGGRGGGWPEDQVPTLSQAQWDALVAAARSAPQPAAAPQPTPGRGGGGGGRGGFQPMQPSDLYPALSRLAARWGKPDLIPPRLVELQE